MELTTEQQTLLKTILFERLERLETDRRNLIYKLDDYNRYCEDTKELCAKSNENYLKNGNYNIYTDTIIRTSEELIKVIDQITKIQDLIKITL